MSGHAHSHRRRLRRRLPVTPERRRRIEIRELREARRPNEVVIDLRELHRLGLSSIPPRGQQSGQMRAYAGVSRWVREAEERRLEKQEREAAR